MIQWNAKFTLALGVLGLTLCGLETASAQYVVTGTGTAPQGGNIVVGSGTSLGRIASGNPSGFLTTTGGDYLTLTIGSVAQSGSNHGATIKFGTPNDTLINNGTINGALGEHGTDAGVGVSFLSPDLFPGSDIDSTSILNEKVINNGAIFGALNGGSTIAGTALSFFASGTIQNIAINNSGLLIGAPSGDSTIAGAGVSIYSEFTSINGVTVLNSGVIAGGSETGDAGIMGTALSINAGNGVFNVAITNAAGGSIIGGNGNSNEEDFGNSAGDAINIFDQNQNLSDINTVTIVNSGSIQGGSGNSGATSSGNGISIVGLGNVSNISITNNAGGSIIGGNSNVGNGFEEEEFFGGAATGAAISIESITLSGDIEPLIEPEFGTGGNVTNVTINNFGLIQGGNSTFESEFGGSGIAIAAISLGEDAVGGNISNVSINNSGSILGGTGAATEEFEGNISGFGIIVFAISDSFDNNGGNISNVAITNTGNIIGGAGASGSEDFNEGGYGIVIDAENGFGEEDVNGSGGNISNVSIINTGNIIGGNGGNGSSDSEDDFGGSGGEAIGIFADGSSETGLSNGNIKNLTILNSGNILGGNGGTGEFDNSGGAAIEIVAESESFDFTGSGVDLGGGIQNSKIVNTGNIIGGNGGSSNHDFSEGGDGGYGIEIEVENFDEGDEGAGGNTGGSIQNLSIINTGNILGGNGGNGSNDAGGDGGDAISIEVFGENESDLENNNFGNIQNLSIINTGNIIGGNGGSTTADFGENGGSGGNGITLESFNESDGGLGGTLQSSSITNFGRIAGGNGGNALISGGLGGEGGEGISIEAQAINGLTISNASTGVIVGGNGGSAVTGASGGNGGAGIDVEVESELGTANLTITNFGYIAGGNGGANGGEAAPAIAVFGNGSVINNWGVISAGSGSTVEEGLPSGFPAAAIIVSGSNNTINLNGHSAVYGTLKGANNGPNDGNNVLNLNFTGLTPQAIASLKAELVSQGYPNNDFTGTFTVRGVTYYVDPLLINLNVTSYQQLGFTPNQRAIGASLDSIAVNPTGQLLALYNAIDQSGNVPYALESLSPQPYQIYSDIAQATTDFMTLSIDERLNNLRDGSESIDTTGIGGGSDHTTTAGYDKDGKNVVVPDVQALQKRWGFFAQGSGLFASVDAHGGDLSNAGFTTSGLIAGVDGKVNDHLVLGLLFNYDYTVADLDQVGSKANVQTLGGGIYAGYHNGDWYGNGLAAYGHNDYNSNRNIFFPGFGTSALGDTNGSQESVNIDGGYDFHLLNNKLTVGPIAGLQYVHLNVNSFNEAGAGAADLAVGGQDVDSLRSRFGFRADYKTQIGKEVAFATEFRAAWQHEFMDDNHAIDGAFIGSGLGGFAVETTKPQRDAALVGVGVNFTVRDTMTLFFDYDVQAGQESYLEQSVKGGIKLSF